MATTCEESIGLFKGLIRGQWGHKSIRIIWKIQKKPWNKVGADTDGDYCTYDVSRCYSLFGRFSFIDTLEPLGLYFREIL